MSDRYVVVLVSLCSVHAWAANLGKTVKISVNEAGETLPFKDENSTAMSKLVVGSRGQINPAQVQENVMRRAGNPSISSLAMLQTTKGVPGDFTQKAVRRSKLHTSARDSTCQWAAYEKSSIDKQLRSTSLLGRGQLSDNSRFTDSSPYKWFGDEDTNMKKLENLCKHNCEKTQSDRFDHECEGFLMFIGSDYSREAQDCWWKPVKEQDCPCNPLDESGCRDLIDCSSSGMEDGSFCRAASTLPDGTDHHVQNCHGYSLFKYKCPIKPNKYFCRFLSDIPDGFIVDAGSDLLLHRIECDH